MFLLLIILQYWFAHYSLAWGVDYYCLNDDEQNQCLNELKLYANPLVSPREFNPINYDTNLFCTVKNDKFLSQSLGQALIGDRLQSIPYKFKFNENVACQKVCQITIENMDTIEILKNIIQKTYTQRWYGDNIPVVYCRESNGIKSEKGRCDAHFFVGCGINHDDNDSDDNNSNDNEDNNFVSKESHCVSNFDDAKKFVVFNHLIFTVTYKEEKVGESTFARIIHINVDLTSAKDKCNGDLTLNSFFVNKTKYKLPITLNYSYSIQFVKNNSLSEANRWDYLFYGQVNNYKSQWLNFGAIVAIFIIFSIAIGVNFYNLLSKDIIRYTQLIDNAQLDIQDEYGWKLLQGDVFRPPKFPLILATTVGCGVQLISMVMISLSFAAIKLLSNQPHRALITCVVVFYILFGILSGYVSARLYKFFGGIHWKMCVIGTSFIHPGILFLMLFGVNFWLWIFNSPTAVKPLIMVGIFFLWILISVPLSFLGSFIGFRQRVIQSPVKINHIPRFIPSQSLTTHRVTCIIFGGIPPFICLFWQIFYLIRSVWIRLHYAMFGFLFVAALISVIVCAEVAVILGYLHLSSEDYRWQWRSFFTTASTSLYCFIVVIYYYVHSNVTGSLGAYAYFTYSLVILYMLALAFGSVGFLSCFFVFLKMYSSIKVD